MTYFDIKKCLAKFLRGMFEQAIDEDEELLNKTIELHMSTLNMDYVQRSKYSHGLAACEFCDNVHGFKDPEFCELVLDDTKVNKSVETAKKFTIKNWMKMLEHKRAPALAVVLKTGPVGRIGFEQLVPKFRKVGFKEDEDDEEEKEKEPIDQRVGHGLSLASCFKCFSEEETLGGDDQWYCNKCKEHRDITKKLEVYKVPKIMCI